MLYIDGKRQTDFSKELEVLKGIFPNSFTGKKKAPIIINLNKAGLGSVTTFRAGVTDVPLGNRPIHSLPTHLKPSGRFLGEDNMMHQWMYTQSQPTYSKTGEPVFNAKHIPVTNGMPIDPVANLEMLVALYFYSPNFTNNVVANPAGKFTFLIPAAEAKARIANVSVQHKYMSMLLVDETRMSSSKLNNVMILLAFTPTGVEDDDRTLLYDRAIANRDGFRERLDRAVANVDAMAKSSKGESNVNSLIKSLTKEGLLIEKDGFWTVKNKNGAEVKTIVESKGKNKTEKELGLLEFLNVSPKDVEFLESLLQ
jgi:hypothetical protein